MTSLRQDGQVPLVALSALTSWLRMAEESKTGDIGPGLGAFLIVVLLAVATFVLIRSMLNQIKKVPPSFDPPPADSGPTGNPAMDQRETDQHEIDQPDTNDEAHR